MTMDLLDSPVKKADEFQEFSEMVRILFSKDQDFMRGVVARLNDNQRVQLNNIMNSKRIAVTHKGSQQQVARRIIHVKRSGGVGKGGGGVPKEI